MTDRYERIRDALKGRAAIANTEQGEWPKQFRCDEAAQNIDACKKVTPPPVAGQVYHGDVPNFDIPVQPEAREDDAAEQPQGEMVLVPRMKLDELRWKVQRLRRYDGHRCDFRVACEAIEQSIGAMLLSAAPSRPVVDGLAGKDGA